MKDKKLSIHIVAWNSMSFLPDLLDTIMKQTYRDFNVLVIDNASDDGVGAFLRETYPEVTVLRNPRNQGFAGAHNQGIRYVLDHWPQEDLKDRFILVTNPDILLEPNYLQELMAVVGAYPKTGSFSGKLMRAFGENLGDEALRETVKSDRFDTTGLKGYRSRRMVDRGAGAMDTGQYDELEHIFGAPGALPLFRAQTLKDVVVDGEYFDTDFFAYKEDIDLAWRMQWAGWDSLYVPSAVAYHYRGVYGPEKTSMIDRVRNRSAQSVQRVYYSTRNHWLMLLKNLRFSDFIVHGLWIMPSEMARLVYSVVFESVGRKAVMDVLRLLPRMLKKRRAIKRSAVRSAKEVRSWFTN